MLKRLKTHARPHGHVLKKIGAHLVFQGVAMVLPFLLLPVVTHLLTPREYGLNALYLSIVTFTSAVMAFGIDQVVAADHFRRSPRQQQQLMCVYFLFLAAMAIVSQVLLIAFANPLAALLGFSPRAILTFAILPALMGISIVGQVVTMLKGDLKKQGLFIIGRPGFVYLVGLPAIWLGGNHWYLLLLGTLAGQVILGALTLHTLWRQGLLAWAPDLKTFHNLLALGGAVLIYNITFPLVGMVERVSIEHFAGPHEVGLYAIMSTMTSAVTMGFIALSRVSAPWNIRKITEGTPTSRRAVLHLLYAYYAGIVLAFALFGCIGGWLVQVMTGPGYADAARVAPWLSASIMFFTLFMFTAGMLIYEKKAWIISLISIAGCLLSLVLNVWLVPILGFEGAAIAGIFSYGGMFAATLACSVVLLPYPWKAALRELPLLLKRKLKAL